MRMSLRLLVAGGLAAFIAGLMVFLLADTGTVPRLAGAEQLADGDGSEGLWATAAGDIQADRMTLDDLPVGGTTVVRPGDDDVLLVVEDVTEAGLIQASPSGVVERVGPVVFNGKTTAFGINSSGTYGVATGTEMLLSSNEWLLPGAGTRLRAPFEVGALVVVDDGSVLVGSRTDARIDMVSADEEPHRLLGPSGDPDAEVTTDDPLGAIVALARLDDGRIAFVADSEDGYRLYLLDDSTVRPIPTETTRSNPVRSPEVPLTDDSVRRDRLPMTPLAPGPDGNVLTIGLNDEDVPEINLVDVDTGDTELLATLDGVEPTLDEPVSAALAGDDLVFTAHGSIWRLADATDR